jgi:hypothetical protein
MRYGASIVRMRGSVTVVYRLLIRDVPERCERDCDGSGTRFEMRGRSVIALAECCMHVWRRS